MNRYIAKKIHESCSNAYWIENPAWDAGSKLANLACRLMQSLPISSYEIHKNLFFDTDKLIAVSGESVVADNGDRTVDKYMFRYPGHMQTEMYKKHVEDEVRALTASLGSVALNTEVSIKEARIFRQTLGSVNAVTQRQPLLNLEENPVFDVRLIEERGGIDIKAATLRDIEKLIEGTDNLASTYGYYPDIVPDSGNLRYNKRDGHLTLIDVMPVYEDGNRLLGDKTSILPKTLRELNKLKGVAGSYGKY